MGSVHLIRHGQASWGSDNYDLLSPVGHRQAAALGMSWEASGWTPTSAVAGSMVRHGETANGVIEACGAGHHEVDEGMESGFHQGYDVDDGWNEFDHLAIASAMDPSSLTRDPREFQQVLNAAIDQWIAGVGDHAETYQTFVERVMSAFERAAAKAGSGQSVVVFTSGGPIALVTSHLLTGDASLFQRINDVVVNASATTVLVGRSGRRLLAFNEHTHLPRDLVTFR